MCERREDNTRKERLMGLRAHGWWVEASAAVAMCANKTGKRSDQRAISLAYTNLIRRSCTQALWTIYLYHLVANRHNRLEANHCPGKRRVTIRAWHREVSG